MIYNNQGNTQYLRLTEYDPLLHAYVAISNTMDILTFQFAMEHIKNAYNMFYAAFLFHLLSSVHMFECSIDILFLANAIMDTSLDIF